MERLVKYTTCFIIVLFFITLFLLQFAKTNRITAAGNITDAYDTLTNPRLSFKGIVATTAGNNIISLLGKTGPDENLEHLFPGDDICFPGQDEDGCVNQQEYDVTSVDIGNTKFTISPVLVDNPLPNDYAVASQSARHSISFSPTTDLSGTESSPAKILISIPRTANTGKTNPNYNADGIPDDDGFDSASLPTSGTEISTYITLSSSPEGIVLVPSSTTLTTITNYHLVTIGLAGTVSSSTTISISIGSTDSGGSGTINRFINPTKSSTHVAGVADIRSILVETQNASSETVDTGTIRVAPIEGVMVSATVDQTLSFKICGVDTDRTLNSDYEATCTWPSGISTPTAACGIGSSTFDFQTDSVHVSFNAGAAILPDTFYTGAQYLELSTNASSGYDLTVYEEDQMGLNHNICSGVTPSAGDFTFGANTCIKDTLCNVTPCTESSEQNWTEADTYPGLGFALQDINNTDAAFEYIDAGGELPFDARQFADMDRKDPLDSGNEDAQNIMSSSGPVSNSAAYACYRLAVSNIQPAGYYNNTVKYTATSKF